MKRLKPWGRPQQGQLQVQSLVWLLWVVFVGLLVLVGWAHWAIIDQVSRAQGAVIASSRTQVIQSQEGGTIQALLVKEGDTVEPGDVLVRFEKTRFETQFLEARAKAAGLLATVARLRAEVFGGEPQFSPELRAYPDFKASQLQLLNKRRAAIDAELASLQGLLTLAEQELAMTEPLLASGDVSRTEVIRLQKQIAELNAQMSNRRNRYFQDSQAELNKALEELAGVEQTLAQRKSQLESTELKAPVKGIVKNVRITTLGGVIRPGEEVMQIVPVEDDLVIEARLSPADIAFVRPGMQVSVKIDAYDYTVFGDLTGQVLYISADTLKDDLRQGEEPYYRIQVQSTGRQFRGRTAADLTILPGMTATIEIKTGQRSVLQYLLKPVVKTLSESLGER
jgi:membrane fusion protein, adhesin transport system